MFTPRKPWQLDRRTFLRSAGVSLALPWLEAMGARSGSLCHAGEMTPTEIPRRAYFSVWGFFNNRAVPKETGKDYSLPAPFDALNRTEGAVLAREVQRNVERLRFGVIRHRTQALEP